MSPRCPECGGFLHFSFMHYLTHVPVYQCSWAGVMIYDEHGKLIGHSLDHRDRFFIQDADTHRWLRVTPIPADRSKGQWFYEFYREQAA